MIQCLLIEQIFPLIGRNKSPLVPPALQSDALTVTILFSAKKIEEVAIVNFGIVPIEKCSHYSATFPFLGDFIFL